MDDEKTKMRDAIIRPSKMATLTIADTYKIEMMGVQFATDHRGLSENVLTDDGFTGSVPSKA